MTISASVDLSSVYIQQTYSSQFCINKHYKMLKQYMFPTGPNKYLRGITPTKTDKLKLDLF